MSTARPGFALPLLLLAGFRALVDDLHARLAGQGHPDARPSHGFALQAVGPDGTSAAELGRRLGVTKQAAAKTIAALEGLGYVERAADPADARRKIVRPTARGRDLLHRSAVIFDQLRREWAARLGEERVAALEDDLRTVTGDAPLRPDASAWFAEDHGPGPDHEPAEAHDLPPERGPRSNSAVGHDRVVQPEVRGPG